MEEGTLRNDRGGLLARRTWSITPQDNRDPRFFKRAGADQSCLGCCLTRVGSTASGSARSSFTDVLALVRNERGLICIAVEAKVDEPFGPTLLTRRSETSSGQNERIDYLHRVLRLKTPLDVIS